MKFVKEEGRISRLNCVAPKVDCKPPKTEQVRVTSSCLNQGTAITKGEWKEQPLCDRDKGLKWYDFTIDSLQLSGLISEMKFMQLREGSMAAADALDFIEINNVNNENENVE